MYLLKSHQFQLYRILEVVYRWFVSIYRFFLIIFLFIEFSFIFFQFSSIIFLYINLKNHWPKIDLFDVFNRIFLIFLQIFPIDFLIRFISLFFLNLQNKFIRSSHWRKQNRFLFQWNKFSTFLSLFLEQNLICWESGTISYFFIIIWPLPIHMFLNPYNNIKEGF